MIAFINALRSHADAIIAVGLVVFVLGWLEFALSRRFRVHEQVEIRNLASVQLLSETAVGTAREAARHVDELRSETTLTQVRVEDLSDEVRMTSRRLGAVEERLMRAALAGPGRRDDP